MKRLNDRDSEAMSLWLEILKSRVETGEPYIMFKDNINKDNPLAYRMNNLDVSRNIRFYHAITNFTTTLVSTNLSTSQVKFANTTTNVPELNGYKYIAAYLNDGTLVNSKVGVFNPTTGSRIDWTQ